jgi:hypothetical protein
VLDADLPILYPRSMEEATRGALILFGLTGIAGVQPSG